MKKFKCTYIKIEPIATMGKKPMQLVEQEILTDQDGITVITPKGYTLFQIIEYLEPLNQCKNEN